MNFKAIIRAAMSSLLVISCNTSFAELTHQHPAVNQQHQRPLSLENRHAHAKPRHHQHQAGHHRQQFGHHHRQEIVVTKAPRPLEKNLHRHD